MAERRERGLLKGHMAAAERSLRRWMAAVDVLWEVADARCPATSRNPRLARLAGSKPRVVVLAKADLADEAVTAAWLQWFQEKGELVIASGPAGPLGGASALLDASRQALERAGAARRRAELRAMVVGIPNVGKSSLMNRLIGRRRSPVGAKPGVTRGPLWLRAGGVLLLDLPGILPPRAGREGLWRLAAIGALTEGQADWVDAASELVEWLRQRNPHGLVARYALSALPTGPEALLEAIGRARGALGPGGHVDLERAARALLTDFQHGLLGRISLEEPSGRGGRAGGQG